MDTFANMLKLLGSPLCIAGFLNLISVGLSVLYLIAMILNACIKDKPFQVQELRKTIGLTVTYAVFMVVVNYFLG